MNEKLYLGIDVGTGSVRAGLFDGDGSRRGTASVDIQLWRPQTDFVEQSSENIWVAVEKAVLAAMKEAGCSPDAIPGSASTLPTRRSPWTPRISRCR